MKRLDGDRLERELSRFAETGVDDVAVRRVRGQLLAWAEAETTRRWEKRAQVYAWWPRVAAVALVVMAAGLGLDGWRRWHVTPDEVESSVASLEADAARWRSVVDEAVEKIDLSDGTLRLRVNKKPGGKRVIVRVPDGEIEDLGTVFHVVVRDGRTARVGVDEGSVTIRLHGMAPIVIGAGQTWERGEERVVFSRSPSARARAVTPEPAIEDVSVPAPPPQADREDAAYLAVIRAARAGDVARAKALAADYLREFPNGFRREEVRRVHAYKSLPR